MLARPLALTLTLTPYPNLSLTLPLTSCEVLVAGAEGGERRVIAALGPGDFFGETGLLEGRKTRNASVVCTSPTEVMRASP